MPVKWHSKREVHVVCRRSGKRFSKWSLSGLKSTRKLLKGRYLCIFIILQHLL